MDPLIGATLIGAGGSLLGGLFGANSQSKQNAVSREQIALTEAAKAQDYLQNLAMLYGPQRAREMFKARYGNDQYEQMFGRSGTAPSSAEQARIRTLEDQRRTLMSGGTLGANNRSVSPASGLARTRPAAGTPGSDRAKALADIDAELNTLRTGGAGNKGKTTESDFDKMFGDATLLEQYKGLLPKAQQQGKDLLSQFDTDSGKAMSMADLLAAEADQYGQRRINQVDVDAGRQLVGLNRGSVAQMAASGVGSGSLFNQATRGNTQNVMETAQRSKDALEDQRLGLKLNLGQQRVGMAQQNAGTRLGIQGANIDRESNLERLPMDVQLNSMQMPSLNPGQSFNAGPLANVSSPAGVFGNAIAGFASNLGGQMYGQAATQQLLQSMLAGQQQQPQSVRPVATSTTPFAQRGG
jgi:hypothetical protein